MMQTSFEIKDNSSQNEAPKNGGLVSIGYKESSYPPVFSSCFLMKGKEDSFCFLME